MALVIKDRQNRELLQDAETRTRTAPSAFPEILSTHLAAATVALAEKCADMIKEDNKGLEEDSEVKTASW